MSGFPIPIVDVGLLDPDGNPAPFHLTFYGVDYREFMITPGGGERIRQALERRGLHGYVSAPWLVAERRWRLASPPVARQESHWREDWQ